jgi:hypothetical protein
MLGGQLALFHHLELGTGDFAQGALEIGGHFSSFVDITANGANKLLHNNFLQIMFFHFSFLDF